MASTCTRRDALRFLATGAAAAALPAGLWAGDPPPRRPNIVYILADDLGYGDLSCYGQTTFATPHIDRLASEGCRFTQHYAGSTVCAPSRCCLMTGLHTGHAQIRGNRERKPEGQFPLAADSVTIPRLLRDAGYVTGAFGKWGLGGPGSSGDPMAHLDRFFGYNCQREAHSYHPDHLWSDRERVELDGATYSHDLIVAAALDFIRANRVRPFCCFLPVTIPHAAMSAPQDLHAAWRERLPQFEDRVGRYGGARVENPVAAFPAMLEALDRDVGRVLALLAELGLDDDTIVLFSSDNGPHGEGGHDPAFWHSNGPLRGIKRDLYEGGIRVPLVARWPGRIPAGRTSDHPCAFWDLLPTCCELAGIAPPADTDGISFLPACEGRAQRAHDHLYWEFPAKGGRQALRRGDWKAVRDGVGRDADAPIELYDLAADPGETTDRAGDHPALVAELAALMGAAHVPNPDFPLFPEERG